MCTENTGNLTVSNNVISKFASWKRTYMPGISWSGVCNTFTGNNLSWSPHCGILGGGNNMLFENNYFSDMCYEGERRHEGGP